MRGSTRSSTHVFLADGTEAWTEEQLAAIVTRDTMIGVAQPKADWTATSSPSAG
jgi:urocanate hydratase